jgi:hypothetical protein
MLDRGPTGMGVGSTETMHPESRLRLQMDPILATMAPIW